MCSGGYYTGRLGESDLGERMLRDVDDGSFRSQGRRPCAQFGVEAALHFPAGEEVRSERWAELGRVSEHVELPADRDLTVARRGFSVRSARQVRAC